MDFIYFRALLFSAQESRLDEIVRKAAGSTFFCPTDNDVLTEKTPFFWPFYLDFWLGTAGVFLFERGIAFLFFFYQNNFEVVRLQ